MNSNGWLGKKLQNQLHTQEIAKKALAKLQQLENGNNVSDVATRTSKDTFPRCPNCSSALGSGTNNISIILSQDLLAKTDIGNLTTIEELSRDPGFQEFLSAQLQLYFKFIVNSSSNNLLSTAKSRALINEDFQSSNSTLAAQKEILRPMQSNDCSSTSQQEMRARKDLNNKLTLSLIEEEKSRRASEIFGGECDEVRNPTEDKSPSKDSSKVVPSVKPSRKTQRSTERPHGDVSIVPKPLQVDTEREKPVRNVPAVNPTETDVGNMDTTTTRLDRSSRSRTNSARAIAESAVQPKLPTTRTGRNRGQNTTANETFTVNAQQSDDDIFKMPLPPKSMGPRSRSNKKQNDITGTTAAGQSAVVEMQSSGAGVFKKPLPLKPKVAVSLSKGSDSSGTSYRSRTGRVSKPPGSFWDPPGDLCTGAQAARKQRKILSLEEKSKMAEKRRADTPLSGFDSESGYSSVSAKVACSRKMSRVEGVKGNEALSDITLNSSEIHTKQTQTKTRGKRNNRTEDIELTPRLIPENRQDIDKVVKKTNEETEKPRRRGKPPLSKKTLDATVILVKVDAAQDKDKVKTTSTELEKLTSRPARAAPAPGAVKKHIFSDSGSDVSDVDDRLISNKTAYYDQIGRENVDATQIAGTSRQITGRQTPRNGRVSLVISSSEEEVDDFRQLVRLKKADPSRIAGNRHLFKQADIDGVSTDEDCVPVRMKRTFKSKKPAAVKQSQVAKTTQKTCLDSEISPVRNPSGKRRTVRKGRYLFSGSSTEDDSLCSYGKNGNNRNVPDSGSFVDDDSYCSTRSSGDKGNPFNGGGRPLRNGNGTRLRSFVSRFRI